MQHHFYKLSKFLSWQNGYESAHLSNLTKLTIAASIHCPASSIRVALVDAVPTVNASRCLVKLEIRHGWNSCFVAWRHHKVYSQCWASKGMLCVIIVHNRKIHFLTCIDSEVAWSKSVVH